MKLSRILKDLANSLLVLISQKTLENDGSITVKFLNFRTSENFAVIHLKFKHRPNLRVFCQNEVNSYSVPVIKLHKKNILDYIYTQNNNAYLVNRSSFIKSEKKSFWSATKIATFDLVQAMYSICSSPDKDGS